MYTYQEFPRIVYGPDGATCTIMSEDERPDGFVNHPDLLAVDTAAEDAKRAEEEAREADRALREGYMDMLDAYDVSYSKRLSTAKLGDLVSQLEKHLAARGEVADDGDGA